MSDWGSPSCIPCSIHFNPPSISLNLVNWLSGWIEWITPFAPSCGQSFHFQSISVWLMEWNWFPSLSHLRHFIRHPYGFLISSFRTVNSFATLISLTILHSCLRPLFPFRSFFTHGALFGCPPRCALLAFRCLNFHYIQFSQRSYRSHCSLIPSFFTFTSHTPHYANVIC